MNLDKQGTTPYIVKVYECMYICVYVCRGRCMCECGVDVGLFLFVGGGVNTVGVGICR